MRRFPIYAAAIAGGILVCAPGLSGKCSADVYSITDLGTLKGYGNSLGLFVNASGQVTVRLTGATPGISYKVYFRLIDNGSSADADTGLALTTDTSGDANGSVTFFPSGTATAGNFVVKSGTLDEFLTGFIVN